MINSRLCTLASVACLLTACSQPAGPVPEKKAPPVAEPVAQPASQPAKEEPISQRELVEAALYGKIDVIDKALKQGTDVNARDPEQRTILMYAAFNGQTVIVQKLIKAGADINAQDQIGTTALMFGASGPDTQTVQTLIDAGAQVNMIDNNEHWTALMWAAAEGQAENVKLLLKNKADISLQDVDGDTAKSFAAKKNHTAVVAVLEAAEHQSRQ